MKHCFFSFFSYSTNVMWMIKCALQYIFNIKKGSLCFDKSKQFNWNFLRSAGQNWTLYLSSEAHYDDSWPVSVVLSDQEYCFFPPNSSCSTTVALQEALLMTWLPSYKQLVFYKQSIKLIIHRSRWLHCRQHVSG